MSTATLITPELIRDEVAKQLAIPDIEMVSRRLRYVRARWLAVYLCHRLTPCTLERIGRAFGGFGQTSVAYVLGRMMELLCDHPELAAYCRDFEDDMHRRFGERPEEKAFAIMIGAQTYDECTTGAGRPRTQETR